MRGVADMANTSRIVLFQGPVESIDQKSRILVYLH